MADMQAAIEAFDQGTDTPTTDPTQTPDSPDTPDTGDAFPWLAATLLGLALTAAAVCIRRFQKHA